MSKPRELAKKRWRAQQQAWELDYWEADAATGLLRRFRPLFPTDAAALHAQAEILARLEQTQPRPVDYNIALHDFVPAWRQTETGRTDERTLTDRLDKLATYVLPILGGKLVRQLAANDVLALADAPAAPRARKEHDPACQGRPVHGLRVRGGAGPAQE